MCGHIVGARYLVQHFLAGKDECPACPHVWFKPAGEWLRESTLRYSILWDWCWGWDLGCDQNYL